MRSTDRELPDGVLVQNAISGTKAPITSFNWSPSGRLMCLIDTDNRVTIFDPKEKEEKLVFQPGSEEPVTAWKDDCHIVLTRNPGLIEVWSTEKKRVAFRYRLIGDDLIEYIACYAHKIAAAASGGILSITERGKSLNHFDFSDGITAICWSRDGQCVYVGMENRLIVSVNVANREITKMESHTDRS